MDDGVTKNGTNDMSNGVPQDEDGSKEGAGGGGSTVPMTSSDYIAAPNLICNGICNACKSDSAFLVDTEGINCWGCKNVFHAINCCDESYCVSAATDFTKTLKHSVTINSKFSTRFGQFLWMCNFCMNKQDFLRTATQDDKVTILDKKHHIY